MYVCLCEAVSDSAIKKAIESGCNTVRAVRDCTGAASRCCKCVAGIQQMINEIGSEHTEVDAQYHSAV